MSKPVIPDISYYETIGSWGKVAANAPFVIMKATQRTNWTDPTLKTVVNGCRRKNIPYWLYSYLEAGSPEYHVDQVKYLINVSKDLGITGSADEASDKYFMGWCLDIENGNSVDAALAAVKYLLGVCGDYKIMVYIGYSDYKKYKKLIEYISGIKNDKVCLWEARYGKNVPIFNALYPPHKECALHQYTDKGTYPGIDGGVDLSRLTGVKPLSWFITRNEESKKAEYIYKPKKYQGEFVTKFPGRGYYKKGDGYVTLRTAVWKSEIEKIQKLVSWVTDSTVTLDGEYGAKTTEAVRKAQYILGVKTDGLYGEKTNSAARKFKK